jgi:hypothetical protein
LQSAGHKRGPNSGVFLQMTCDDQHLQVPGQKFVKADFKKPGDFVREEL